MKKSFGMLSPLWLIVFLGLATSATPDMAAVAADPPVFAIVDGDTLEVGGKIVRLYGVDAPELGQFCLNGTKRYRCGYEAALILTKLVGSGPVECRPTPVDKKDKGQICSVGLVDLAEAMLRRGYAAAPPTSLTIYRRVESEAKQSKLGIWRGDFILPWEWKEGRRLEARGDEPRQACDIKGIVSDKKERVYAVNTDPEYAAIEVDQTRGERLFCSDDEAELAGWRRWPKSVVQQRSAAASKSSN
jgi:endonuclease YncB( thermonuclease family)